MPVEIVVPPLGESLVDATVGQWLKQEGDEVARGEPVVLLETDKVNLEVTADDDGVLARIDHREGDVVTVGEVLGAVGTDGAVASNGAGAVAAAAAGAPAANAPAAEAAATPTPAAAPATAPDAARPPDAAVPGSAPAATATAPAAPTSAGPPDAPAPPGTSAATTAATGAAAPASPSAAPPSAEPIAASAAPATPEAAGDAQAAGRAAPAVRRLAEEHHIDLGSIAGTGPGGRLTREDVLLAAARQQVGTPPTLIPGTRPTVAQPPSVAAVPHAPASTPAAGTAPTAAGTTAPSIAADGREERVRLSRRRRTIAQRLVEAQQTAAMLTTFNEVDMTAVMELRAGRKEAFKERHGVGLGFMSFFTKAAVGALKAFPMVNAELQGDELVLKKHYDIGIAVGVEEGLVVPVVRDADRKSFAQIEREVVELATKAKEGKLALAELQGGTFTITNGGVYGSLMSTPILNAPQVGILGMHAIQQRPVARDGQVVIRPMMYLALSYDHRVVDGREAVQFLVRVKELIEDPETLLLEG